LIEKTPKRVELKCLYNENDLPFLERNLHLSELSFYQPYPPRFINSLYFDTYDLASVDESLNGSSVRTKTRCRWYGDLIQKGKGTLELKKKRGHLSWKLLQKNIFTINASSKSWDGFISPDIISGITKIGLNSHNQFPASLVRYRRKYFVSSDSKIRVTIDNQLQFFDQRLSSVPNVKISENSHAGIVLEIKLLEKNANRLPLISNKINFTPSRFSKYCESLMGRI